MQTLQTLVKRVSFRTEGKVWQLKEEVQAFLTIAEANAKYINAYAMGRGRHKLGLTLTVGGIGIPLYLRKQCEARDPVSTPTVAEGLAGIREAVLAMTDEELEAGFDACPQERRALIELVSDEQFEAVCLKKFSAQELWNDLEGAVARRRLLVRDPERAKEIQESLQRLGPQTLGSLFKGSWKSAEKVLSEKKLCEMVRAFTVPSGWRPGKVLPAVECRPKHQSSRADGVASSHSANTGLPR